DLNLSFNGYFQIPLLLRLNIAQIHKISTFLTSRPQEKYKNTLFYGKKRFFAERIVEKTRKGIIITPMKSYRGE
ncbi:MAG: hypothetical protein IJC34_04095, partial [Lentisphaeria bacterium]|nr:hypothetical protein [Lentisphaeria bacterium]